MNKKLNLGVDPNNIFRRHFFHFGIVGLCGILGFYALYYIGWYELALICVLATPCNIPGYLLLIRKKTNSDENIAMAFICIFAIVLLAAAIILVIQFQIEELLGKGSILTWLWRFCEFFIFQLLCTFCGVFPKSPQE